MMQMEDDEIEAEAADEQEDSSGPRKDIRNIPQIFKKIFVMPKSDSDDSEVEYEERMASERYDDRAAQVKNSENKCPTHKFCLWNTT